MNTIKQILRPYNGVLLVLFAGFLLPGSAQSQEAESLIVKANGHGTLSLVLDERKVTAALAVLRKNGTVLITVTADIQLQAEGTWKTSASSPEEILLKITGGVVKGEMNGSGKLLLTSDRKSIKALTLDVKTVDGREIVVTFVAASAAPDTPRASSRTWLEEIEDDCAGRCHYDAEETVYQFNCTNCPYLLTVCRVPALEYGPTVYCKRGSETRSYDE